MTSYSCQPTMLLEGLFSSRVRVKILTIFLGQREVQCHGRELAKQTGEHFNAVWQELKHLESLGLLKAERVGNQVNYSPNPACVLLAELRALVLKASPPMPVAAVPPEEEPKKKEEKPQAVKRGFVIGEVD